MSQDWLRQRERANAASLQLLARLALLLGRPAGRMILYPVCFYFLIFSVRARAASGKYLRKVLGRVPSLADRFRHYYTFATVALDRIYLLRSRFDQFEIRVSGEEVLAEAQARGQNCFLLGAHLGSFEALHAYGEENGIKVTMMMFEHGSRNMNALARAINPGLERTVIGMGALDSMMKLRDRLESGEWVGMLGDRGLFDGGQVRVPFFGEPAAFPTAPFRIASMFERPVVLMLALYRGGNRYDLHFERLVESPPTDRSGQNGTGRDAAIRGWAARFAERLEHHCRQAPYNWFNFYDFWDSGGPSR